MRILGLDYGTKTVGVAVSDPLKMTAAGDDREKVGEQAETDTCPHRGHT